MSNAAVIPLAVRITSQVAGFRRAGIAHPASPVEYPAERFSAEQLEALRAEPMLTVEVIEQASNQIQPGAKKRTDRSNGKAAGAGQPAPAAAPASTSEVQTTAGETIAPAGGQAAVTELIGSAKQEGPEAPAPSPAPKADAKAKPKGKAKPKKGGK